MGASTEAMAATDTFSWNMERDPALRSTIVAVMWLEGSPDWEDLRQRVDRMSRVMPSLRQRVVEPAVPGARPRRATDARFDLDWHLRRVAAPQPRTRETVLQLARQAAMDAFDKDRPLWVLTLVEGLRNGEAAFVVKLHHSLTDGVGGMRLLGVLFDLEPQPQARPETPPAPEPSQVDPTSLLRDTAASLLDQGVLLARGGARASTRALLRGVRHPWGSLQDATELVGSVYRTAGPMVRTFSPVMRDRATTRQLATMETDLAVLHEAAHAAGVTVNDAFLAAVTGGLRRYHEKHECHVDRLRVTMPISIRAPGDREWGNRITLQRLTLPVGHEDPAERARAIHEVTSAARHERSLTVTDAIAAGLNLLPTAYVSSVLKHVDFLASDVPGSPVPLFLGGARLTGFFAFGPTIGASLNLTLVSYIGHCDIGVNIDTAAVPDPELMVRCLEEGFAEIAALAAPVSEAPSAGA